MKLRSPCAPVEYLIEAGKESNGRDGRGQKVADQSFRLRTNFIADTKYGKAAIRIAQHHDSVPIDDVTYRQVRDIAWGLDIDEPQIVRVEGADGDGYPTTDSGTTIANETEDTGTTGDPTHHSSETATAWTTR